MQKVYGLTQEFSNNNTCEDGHVPAKRVDIVSVRLVKEASLMYKRRYVGSPDHAYEIFKDFLEDLDREIFVVLTLDTKNRPLAVNVAHIGNLSLLQLPTGRGKNIHLDINEPLKD